jgi:exonuclease III
VDQGLRDLASETYVDREERKGEKPSDHVPVVADFSL